MSHKNKPPAFQFYARDWLASPTVQRMTPEERGIYITLLVYAWDSDEPGTITLPIYGLNPRTVRSFLLRWPKTFTPNGAEFDPNLSPNESESKLKSPRKESQVGLKFTNQKLHEQYINLLHFSEIARDRGRKGAMARWGSCDASSIKQALLNDGSASASASASAITKPPLPPLGEPVERKKSNGNGHFNLPEWVNTNSWAAYVEMRKKIRKPMTDRAMELAVMKLESLKSEGSDPTQVLNQSILHSWQGLFPIRSKGPDWRLPE